MQNVSTTDRLLGRDTAGAGDVEEISLATSLEFSGSGSIQRSALTGDVTASAASNATTIANDAVTNAKLANMSGFTVKAKADTGSGDPADLSVGTNTVVGRVAGDIVAAQLATGQVANDAITYAKIQNVSATDRLLGRDTAAAGDIEELTATGGIEFTGTGIQTSAFTGDVTKSAGGTATTIANDAVTTAKILNANVTLAKIANIGTDRLLGRDTASSGVTEELTVGGGIEFTGSGGIQTSAFTSDVTKAAGGTATTIANDAVTYAKMQNVSAASKLLGRGDSGSGDPQEITLGTNLSMSGTTLNASGGGSGDSITINGAATTDADFDDADPAAPTDAVNVKWQLNTTPTPDSISAYLDVNTVTKKIMADMATDRLLGRDTAGTGDPEEISLGTGLTWSGSGSFGIDSTVVTESSTDTLTNKTLTTPVLTTPTINGAKLADTAKTGNYTMTATDYVVRCDASAGAFTITLPAASGIAGTIYKIIRTDVASSTNILTIDANASETIDGLLTWRLVPGEFLTIMSDGTNWVTISHPSPALMGYFFRKNSTENRRYLAGSMGTSNGMLTSTTSPAVDTLWALPFIVGKVTKFDTISFEITTSDAGDNANAGIYYDNGNCYPGALIFNTGSISTGSTGIKDTTITASLQTFQPGLYWLAWETSAPALQMRVLQGGTQSLGLMGFLNSSWTTSSAYGYSVADTYGATLPDPYPSSASYLTAAPSVSVPVPAITLRAV